MQGKLKMIDDILQIFLMLFVLVAIIIAAYYSTRFIGNRSSRFLSGKYIKVIDRIVVANDKSILIVQIGLSYSIIAVTGQGINLLKDLPYEELVEIKDDSKVNSTPEVFANYLNSAYKKIVKNINGGSK